MEERKNHNKVSRLIIILVIAVTVIIAILAYLMYSQKVEADKQIAVLKASEAELQTTVAELQGKLGNISAIANTSENDSDSDYIILYDGCEMKISTGVNTTRLLNKNDENNEKYNTTYYNYEKGKYVGETNGKVIENGIENTYVVNNVKRIAMSKKFNAIPRNFTEINQLPEELMEMADCTSVKINSIDLDGDGTEEKIVCYTNSEAKGDFENTEPVAQSGIILFDSEYKKIANLVTLDDGFAASERFEESKVFLSLDDVDYIDIDNDGIMEIVIGIPEYETDGQSKVSVLKYNKGNLEGTTDVKANVRP